MVDLIEYIGIPGTIAVAIVALYLIMQLIGEFVELCGKVVPEFFKIRKFFVRRRQEKEDSIKTLKEVKQLLNEVNKHYNDDNITQRNEWIKGVDNRAVMCSSQIADINNTLSEVTQALNINTKMTEDMFIENSRDRIIDFAEKAADYNIVLSKEQFRRINRIHDDYENFLKERKRQNGEVDTAYETIQDGYKYRLKNHSFLEDVKGIRLDK
jgi:hypothetical protein